MPIGKRRLKESINALQNLLEILSLCAPEKFVNIITDRNESEWVKFFSQLIAFKEENKKRSLIKCFNSLNFSDLNKSLLIIFESFGQAQLASVSLIKNFKEAPYVPIVVIQETTNQDNIDEIYDLGVDMIINKPMLFEITDKSKPNYESLEYLVHNITGLIVKSEILAWFWRLSLNIISNLEKEYGDKVKVVQSFLIKTRITEKLNIAFGQLRKPITSYDKDFELTNPEFAFLTYWSILNEYLEDWIIEEENGRIITKNNKTLAQRHKQDEKILFKYYSGKIDLNKYPELRTEINEIVSHWNYIYTMVLPEEDYKDGKIVNYDKSPSKTIPAILLENEITDIGIRIRFSILNYFRNTLAFTHSNRKIIYESRVGDYTRQLDCYRMCVRMIEMLNLLFHPQFMVIDEAQMNNAFLAISRLSYYSRINNGINLMRHIGKIKEIVFGTRYEYVISITTNDTGSSTEIRYHAEDAVREKIKQFVVGDLVEIYSTIKSGFSGENKYYQNIWIEEIYKIKR